MEAEYLSALNSENPGTLVGLHKTNCISIIVLALVLQYISDGYRLCNVMPSNIVLYSINDMISDEHRSFISYSPESVGNIVERGPEDSKFAEFNSAPIRCWSEENCKQWVCPRQRYYDSLLVSIAMPYNLLE